MKNKKHFSVGDRVRILNYRNTVSWSGLKPERFGFITKINGAYHYIRPRYKQVIFELYSNEIVHAPLKRN